MLIIETTETNSFLFAPLENTRNQEILDGQQWLCLVFRRTCREYLVLLKYMEKKRHLNFSVLWDTYSYSLIKCSFNVVHKKSGLSLKSEGKSKELNFPFFDSPQIQIIYLRTLLKRGIYFLRFSLSMCMLFFVAHCI